MVSTFYQAVLWAAIDFNVRGIIRKHRNTMGQSQGSHELCSSGRGWLYFNGCARAVTQACNPVLEVPPNAIINPKKARYVIFKA